jgi:hypothetical protein
MRLHVELEDGKAETVFVHAACTAALVAAMDEGDDELEAFEQGVWAAWWLFRDNGWTDAEDWQTFSRIASVSVAADPK